MNRVVNCLLDCIINFVNVTLVETSNFSKKEVFIAKLIEKILEIEGNEWFIYNQNDEFKKETCR